jgi:hypothetical protein
MNKTLFLAYYKWYCEYCWYNFNLLLCGPVLFIAFYRLRNPINFDLYKKSPFGELKIDMKIIKLFLGFGTVYYFLDTFWELTSG